MPARKIPPSIYQLKITLTGIKPPVWRRIQVPNSLALSGLHDLFQPVMGWTGSHLHQFEKDDKIWGDPTVDEFGELDFIDESRVPLGKVLKAEGDTIMYLYDFGDSWRHEVILERILPEEPKPPRPICLGGERRCPPEDVGGVHGYEELLEVLFDPRHEEFERLSTWAGGSVHAEEFDVKAVNAVLARMRWPASRTR